MNGLKRCLNLATAAPDVDNIAQAGTESIDVTPRELQQTGMRLEEGS
jgi:hypothetical protein